MMKPGDKVHVEIFGQSYTLRAGAEPGHIEKVAAYVDQQMREMSQAAGAVDSVRIAVLAALNIADECFRLKTAVHDAEGKAEQRADRLARELSAALDE
jgi:cell division protein ZapA